MKIKEKLFRTKLKNLQVPFPLIHDRETEHIIHCDTCKEAYPIFWYRNQHDKNLKEISAEWLSFTEHKRRYILEEENLRLQELTRTRHISPYKLFIQACKSVIQVNQTIFDGLSEEEKKKQHKKNFINFGQECAALWEGLPLGERKYYDTMYEDFKLQREEAIKDLPPFLRKRFRALKKEQEVKLKRDKPKRPITACMLYVNAMWKLAREELQRLSLKTSESDDEAEILEEKEKIPEETSTIEIKVKEEKDTVSNKNVGHEIDEKGMFTRNLGDGTEENTETKEQEVPKKPSYYRQIHKQATEKWKQLTIEEKAPFQKLYEDNFREYKKKLDEFNLTRKRKKTGDGTVKQVTSAINVKVEDNNGQGETSAKRQKKA